MFRASSCPSSGATTTAVAASGLPLERGGSSVVGRGRPGCDRLRLLRLCVHACRLYLRNLSHFSWSCFFYTSVG